MKSSTETTARKPRGIGRRKCERCGRVHKPVNTSVRYCGSCAARLLALAARGWR